MQGSAQTSYGPGDDGAAVAHIVDLLGRIGLLDGEPPANYDSRVEVAVRAFQQQRGLSVDGVVGPLTYRRLDEARWSLGDRILTHLPGALMAGDDVFALQQRLLGLGFDTGRIDGYFGARTEDALREFQRNVGIPPDGTCGPATLKALGRLAPIVSGGEPNAMRAAERIREAGPQLGGKIVVIDPGRGHAFPAELAGESDQVVTDLARRIEGRLVAIGVQAYLSRPSTGDDGDEAARAAFANRADADLCVSLALDSSTNPDASGVATYYFGAGHHGTVSTAGQRFAGLVQREIAARTDLVDLRSHAKSWDLLRLTRMPAVRVEVGYLTNGGDRQRLSDPGFRDVLAEAVVVAIQRFYLSPDADAHTGVLQVSELRAGFVPE
ncbi:N-acetylmuramoyl-L-alanine amidase [Nocardioides terrisoli]|uniref:N-acetylmuramoyl-L-alanine amidase n=1 Tax=Nocardioides terrisoli TaxID=3388267 RepID=UPI00287B6ECE|nr:peptidoglycan-binding protein [Nocardioides marmorisolisilvae]